MHTFDPNYIVSLVALVLPLLVGAVTNSQAATWVKGWTLAFFSALTGLVTEVISSGFDKFDFDTGIQNAILAFISAHIAYKSGLVKPVAQAVSKATDPGVLDTDGSTGVAEAETDQELAQGQ